MTWTTMEAAARRELLVGALNRHGGNVTTAAAEVGVSRPTFYAQLVRLGAARALGLDADQRGPAPAVDALLPRNVKIAEARWRWARHAAIDQGITTSALVELALDRLRAELEDR